MNRIVPALLFLLLVGVAAPATAQETKPRTSCTICHANKDMFGEEMLQIVSASGVHAQYGLSCQDCHGGNPDTSLAEDMEAAMDPHYAPNPFRGAPARTKVPDFCGRCHSDPVFMKQYLPAPRVDQEAEYWTSHHGKELAAGNTRVATCIDCHGVHGILAVDNPESPVFPTHVAQTCSRCHSNPETMAGATLPDGRPLPVDQYARWSRSVHAQALLKRGDLSAPTCNDCHGNHAATPPGVEAVSFVCGQCHGREAELFRASAKHEGFTRHNEYLAEADSEGCAACHSAPDPQARIHDLREFTECTTCHENHAIIRPTLAFLGFLPESPCVYCHGEVTLPTGLGDSLKVAPEPKRITEHFAEVKRGLDEKAREMGLEGNARFDWLVDQALHLPFHTIPAPESGEKGAVTLRPEFQRLFQKFRIGKTHYTYKNPVSGKEVQVEVMHCDRCHGAEPSTGVEPIGLETARRFTRGMQALTATSARAERMLLAARRGGVEVRNAADDLDQAIDSQIQLEVLVHTFPADSTGKFAEKQKQGMQHSTAALASAEGALTELGNRRRGLIVALVFVGLVLLGLGVRIVQMGRKDPPTAHPEAGDHRP
jgi:hypothetical protein